MFNWIRQNASGAMLMAIGAISLMAIAGVQGCNLAKMVEFDVPREVRKATGLPQKTNLYDFDDDFREWQQHCEAGTDKFLRNRDDAQGWYDLFSMAMNTGMVFADGALAGVPGGGIAIGALMGLGGLLMKKPGTDKILADEKIKSFNAGAENMLAGINSATEPEDS